MNSTTNTKTSMLTMTATRNGWVVARASAFFKRSYVSFGSLARAIGGVVALDRWSSDSQCAITHLGFRCA